MTKGQGKAFDIKGFAQRFGEAFNMRGFAAAFRKAFDVSGFRKSFAVGVRHGVDVLVKLVAGQQRPATTRHQGHRHPLPILVLERVLPIEWVRWLSGQDLKSETEDEEPSRLERQKNTHRAE